MTAKTLLADGPEPAELDGYGPLPAALARGWLRGDTNPSTDPNADPSTDSGEPAREQAQVWLRRLYTSPGPGALVSMDSTSRCFSGGLRRLLITADRRCRTPWCDAPIRHADHCLGAAQGGPTSLDNGQGLCEACNYTKNAAGWTTVPHHGRITETITPTGHSYVSRPPPVVGASSGQAPRAPNRENEPVPGSDSRRTSTAFTDRQHDRGLVLTS